MTAMCVRGMIFIAVEFEWSLSKKASLMLGLHIKTALAVKAYSLTNTTRFHVYNVDFSLA
jgi:hypothetical protein